MGSREPQRVHEQPCTEIKTQVEEARVAILPPPIRANEQRALMCTSTSELCGSLLLSHTIWEPCPIFTALLRL